MGTFRMAAALEVPLSNLDMEAAKLVCVCLARELVDTGKVGLGFDAAIVGVAMLLDKMIKARDMEERFEGLR